MTVLEDLIEKDLQARRYQEMTWVNLMDYLTIETGYPKEYTNKELETLYFQCRKHHLVQMDILKIRSLRTLYRNIELEVGGRKWTDKEK